MLAEPRVLIVVLNWNKLEYLKAALTSLAKAETDGADILVVDNGSDLDPGPEIQADWPSVLYHRNAENLGGAAGFNTGIRYAIEKGSYDFVWLLDEDVEVDPAALPYLLQSAKTHPSAYLIGSKVYHYGSRVIQECGGRIDWQAAMVAPQKKGIRDTGNTNEVYRVDYAPACSLLINLKYAEQVGLMNENFFVLWDDMEWGARTNHLGLEVIVDERAIIWHHSGGSTKQQLWRKYYYTRNRLNFFNKYIGAESPRRVYLWLLGVEARLATFQEYDSGFHSASAASMLGIEDSRNGVCGKLVQPLPDNEVQGEPSYRNVRCDTPRNSGRHFVFLRFSEEEPIPGARDWASVRGAREKLGLLFSVLSRGSAVIGYKPHLLLAAAEERYLLHAGNLYRLPSGGVVAGIRFIFCAALIRVIARIRSSIY